MDSSFYLDVNRFARDTPWLHGFMAAYAIWGGIVALALCLLAGWWRGRSRAAPARPVAAAVWAGLGTLVAVGVNQPIANAVGRVRPYYVLHNVELLVPKAHDFSFPSDHAVAAGAVIAGLWLADRLLASVATFVGLLLAFARVYVGAHYPGDVAAGLVLGALVVLALRPLAMVPLAWMAGLMARTPLWPLVASSPAAHGSPGATPSAPAPAAPSASASSASSASGGRRLAGGDG